MADVYDILMEKAEKIHGWFKGRPLGDYWFSVKEGIIAYNGSMSAYFTDTSFFQPPQIQNIDNVSFFSCHLGGYGTIHYKDSQKNFDCLHEGLCHILKTRTGNDYGNDGDCSINGDTITLSKPGFNHSIYRYEHTSVCDMGLPTNPKDVRITTNVDFLPTITRFGDVVYTQEYEDGYIVAEYSLKDAFLNGMVDNSIVLRNAIVNMPEIERLRRRLKSADSLCRRFVTRRNCNDDIINTQFLSLLLKNNITLW